MEIPELSKELQDLVLKGRHYKYPKGQILQSTDDRQVFCWLRSGYVKRYLIADDGSLGVQVIYGPGDFFPITLVFKILLGMDFNDGMDVYHYQAMTAIEVNTIDRDSFKEDIEANPLLYRDLMAISAKRLYSTLGGLENLTLKSSYNRLAHQLAYLAHNFGRAMPGGGAQIDMQLTHQDLADILSLTRETISTNMIKLREKGLVRTGRKISIPNIKRLEKEAHN